MGIVDEIDGTNDPRFDIDWSSYGAARQLKELDGLFARNAILDGALRTIQIADKEERLYFTIAAYNAGQGKIAKAQQFALKDGKDPTKWDDVKNYLIKAGAKKDQEKEILDYVELVLKYAEEFSKKSKAKNMKGKKPIVMKFPEGAHWVTLGDGRHVLIGDKK